MICGKAACGMLYAVRKSSSAVGYCALSIRCGTRNEEAFHSGIAHFTEHTIFKGTSRHSSSYINSCLDKLGGEINAFTTKEEIVIHSMVLKEDLGKAAELMLDLATCPSFPSQEIDTERGVVIDEILSYKDSPADDVYDKFEGMLFDGHPLSRPILGTVDSVKKISSEELGKFVKEKFTPESMTLALVADIDEKKMESKALKLLEKCFPGHVAEIPVAGEPRVGIQGYGRPSPIKFDKTIDKRNHEVNAVLGNFAPSMYDVPGKVAAVLLGNILAGPAANSILNNVLREKNGWVYGVETSYTQYSDTGIMTIGLGCEKKNLQKCEAAIAKELEKLQNTVLSPFRLRAAKKQLLGQLAISSDNGESQCLSMVKNLSAYGRIDSDNSVKALVEAVSAEDIRNMACQIFDRDRISRLVYL